MPNTFGKKVIIFVQDRCPLCKRMDNGMKATMYDFLANNCDYEYVNLSELSAEEKAKVVELYQLTSTPTTLVIDGNVTKERFNGFVEVYKLYQVVNKL